MFHKVIATAQHKKTAKLITNALCNKHYYGGNFHNTELMEIKNNANQNVIIMSYFIQFNPMNIIKKIVEFSALDLIEIGTVNDSYESKFF